VVAGPGSGKTRVLTHRVALLLDRGVPDYSICAVTFTNKAAAEMRERLGHLVGEDALRRLWVATFHAMCVRILRIEHEAAGLPRDFSIADTGDTDRMLRRIVRELRLAPDDAEAKKYASAARSAISWVRNRGMNELEVASHSDLPRIAEVAAEYRKRLSQAGAVDFDDLLLRTRALFASGGEAAQRWGGRFRHVLVDEFQDTNPIQMELVRHLTSVHGNLTAVGDLDQSVYAFRAADPEGMARFTKEWAGASVVILDRNYRSTPAIVEVATSVIAPNPAQHRAVQHAATSGGDPVLLRSCEDDRDEAAWVAAMVRSIAGPLSEHAVLVRTNSQTRVLEEAFTRAKLPYKLVGAVRFFDRAEVRDAMAWLRAATNPFDTMAFERAAAAPRRGVGEQAFARLREAAGPGGDLLAACERLAEAGGRGAAPLGTLATDLRAVYEVALNEGPDAALLEIYRRGLRTHWGSGPEGEGRLENLDELVRAAGEFCRTGRDAEGRDLPTLTPDERTRAFLEHAALVAAADDSETDTVSVMTVHAAKGREFDVVYVVGLEEELLPHLKALSETGGVEEERRLFFVAVSRARKRLLISHARRRFAFGRVVDTRPSRFLDDLPPSVLRSNSQTSSRTSGPTPRMGTFNNQNRSSEQNWRPRPQHSSQSTRASAPRSESSGQVWGSSRPARQAPPPPAANTPRLDPASVAVGMRVRHNTFGSGEITKLSGTVATVRFPDKTRTLDLSLAPLSAE
jgi:DNA helicase II / ATP-dependent DNA helicase PcrA